MAITGAALTAALTAALESGVGGAENHPRVLRELPPYKQTLQNWLIEGRQPFAGKVRRIRTTAANDAATQATAVLAELDLVGNAP